MQQKRRWLNNIYARLLIILLSIAILPSVLASIMSYQVSISNAKIQSENYSKQLLSQITSANDITFEQMQAFIYEIMINFTYYSDVMSKVPHSSAYLDVWNSLNKKRQAYQKHIKNFTIVDLQSKKVISSLDGIAVYDFDDFRQQGDANLMDMIFSSDADNRSNDLFLRRTSGDENVLTYIFKYGPTGKESGYIAVDIDEAKMTHPEQAEKYGYLFVRNNRGMLLTDRNLDVFRAIQSSKTAGQYVVISEKSDISGLQYDYVIPKQNITKNNRILLWSILSICLALVLIGALAAWLSSKNIYTPLRNLLRYIRQLSGDRTESEPVKGQNDYNYLEQIFTTLNQENKAYMNAIRMNQGMFKQRQLGCLLTGNVSGFELLEVPSNVRMDFPHDRYLVIVIELEDIADFRQKFTPLEQELMYYAIENITEEIFGEFGTAAAGHLEPNRIVALLNYDNNRFEPERPIELCKQAQAQIERYLQLSVSVGISEPGIGMASVKACCEQAAHAVSHKVFFGKGSIVHYPTVARMDNNRPFDSNAIQWSGIKEQLKIYFRMNEWDKIEDCISGMIGSISCVGITQTDLQFVFLQYVSCLSDTCFEFSLQLPDVFGEHFYMDRKLAGLSTVEDLKLQMTALAGKLFGKLEEKKSHIHQEMIEKILTNIRDNIENNITLESIAEKVFMHPSYLSRICKTITGFSLGEQIVQAKINRAKELLTETNVNVGEIAERLGYTTPRAFYRIFKDYTGFTPSDFRKQEGLRNIIE